jgi:hypothetical protein
MTADVGHDASVPSAASVSVTAGWP